MKGLFVAALIFLVAATACGTAAMTTPDAAPAAVCGDGVASGMEGCDGADLRGRTCGDLGFNAGELGCNAACVLDLRTCRLDLCGDGQVTGPEACDDQNAVTGDCCDGCRAEPGCEVERDDTVAGAFQVTLDGGLGRVRGVLRPGDVDVFAVTIPPASTGVLGAWLVAGDAAAAAIEILDGDGVLAGAPPCPAIPGGDNPRTSAAGLAPGDVYVRLHAPPFTAGDVPYELALDLAATPCGDGVLDEGEECDGSPGCPADCRLPRRVAGDEPDDVLPLAHGPWLPPFVVRGGFDPAALTGEDHDWFALDLARPAKLTVSLRPAPDARCLPFRGATLVGHTFPDGNFGEWPLFLQADPGRYHIEVTVGSGPPAYELVVGLASECGDAIVQPPEECDGDPWCDSGCRVIAVCGDGIPGLGEECDDGNTTDGDGCSATCLNELLCVRDRGDECEIGDACCDPFTCLLVVGCVGEREPNDSPEQADGPFDLPFTFWTLVEEGDEDVVAITLPAAADVRVASLATLNGCVGFRDIGVALGGARVAADPGGCFELRATLGAGTQLVRLTPSFLATEVAFTVSYVSRCGDGVVEGAESCDDDSASCLGAACRPVARCGDGIVTRPERCDDGNLEAGDGCTATCVSEGCGDGVVMRPEACDDGNLEAGDGCSPTCTVEPPPPRCGDGTVTPPEVCDDGDLEAGDGCGATCAPEAGHVFETEPNDDGTPSVANSDFSAAHAGGPFDTGVIIHAALSPPGDDDVFAFDSPAGHPVTAIFETLGPGEVCGIDTVLRLRDASAALLGYDDDSGSERCSRLEARLQPGARIFVQVTDYGDNSVIPAYRLRVSFAP